MYLVGLHPERTHKQGVTTSCGASTFWDDDQNPEPKMAKSSAFLIFGYFDLLLNSIDNQLNFMENTFSFIWREGGGAEIEYFKQPTKVFSNFQNFQNFRFWKNYDFFENFDFFEKKTTFSIFCEKIFSRKFSKKNFSRKSKFSKSIFSMMRKYFFLQFFFVLSTD